MSNGTGKVLDSQNEFYLKLLEWYAESRKKGDVNTASACRTNR